MKIPTGRLRKVLGVLCVAPMTAVISYAMYDSEVMRGMFIVTAVIGLTFFGSFLLTTEK